MHCFNVTDVKIPFNSMYNILGDWKTFSFFSGYVNGRGRNVESKPRQSGWCKSSSHSNPVGCSTTKTAKTALKEDIFDSLLSYNSCKMGRRLCHHTWHKIPIYLFLHIVYSFYQKQHGLVYANCICSEMGDAITNRKKKLKSLCSILLLKIPCL